MSATYQHADYPTSLENLYCTSPAACQNETINVLFIGSGIALAAAHYLRAQMCHLRLHSRRILVVDAGPADFMTHAAHTRFPRQPFVKCGSLERLGGRLAMWGVSIPRPAPDFLKAWPYDHDDLIRRFERAENMMGGCDPTPASGRIIEKELLGTLPAAFRGYSFRVAPLAINRDGRRWCPLDDVADMVSQGLQMITRFRVTELAANGGRVLSVRGHWQGDRSQTWTLRPQIVVLAVGVEPSLPLLRQVMKGGMPIEAADHMRIDLHGSLPADYFGGFGPDELGIGVLVMDYLSVGASVPAHLEIKVAPRSLWRRGYMQSSDNLRGRPDCDDLDVQIQCVSAMNDRLPAADLLNVGASLPPVMSERDVMLHGELCTMMGRVAHSIGLERPAFCLRPLLANHHCYGALRVGRGVTKEFNASGLENLYVLPPTAYVDQDDDANPTLKSVVLSTYAMDAIISEMTNNR